MEYWPPLLNLLATTDEEAIAAYAKTGIIALCGAMIATNVESNTLGGLQILARFSSVRQLVDSLLFD